jgi:hypothetical protein
MTTKGSGADLHVIAVGRRGTSLCRHPTDVGAVKAAMENDSGPWWSHWISMCFDMDQVWVGLIHNLSKYDICHAVEFGPSTCVHHAW